LPPMASSASSKSSRLPCTSVYRYSSAHRKRSSASPVITKADCVRAVAGAAELVVWPEPHGAADRQGKAQPVVRLQTQAGPRVAYALRRSVRAGSCWRHSGLVALRAGLVGADPAA